MYTKVIKYITWVLIAISVVILGWGCLSGLTSQDGLPIDLILYWAYVLVGVAVLAIVGIGLYTTAKNGSKGLLKIGAIILGALVLVGIAYVLAPASQPIGYVGKEPEFSALKLTDTVLNLTYFTCAAAIIAIFYSAIRNAVHK